MPFSATSMRLLPSNPKGFVTIPIVSIPISFAIFATVGAAPVPVPPPIPVAIKTMSAPFSAFVISSAFSSAALAPISGFAPAPWPLVSLFPIAIL